MNHFKHTGKGDPSTPNPDKAALDALIEDGEWYEAEGITIGESDTITHVIQALPLLRRLRDTVEVDDEAVQEFLSAQAAGYDFENEADVKNYAYKVCDTAAEAAPSIRAAFTRLKALEGKNARLRESIDKIYNHNEAARAAVVEHYGTTHKPLLNADQEVGK